MRKAPTRPLLLTLLFLISVESVAQQQANPYAPDVADYAYFGWNARRRYRDLNHSHYRFLWNALLNWSALPATKR
jgi:hypothetical protein